MSKIGIALAGGGPLGGIYEVGACAALEESIDGLDLAAADVCVGVSAGGFVAAALANGIGPAALVQSLADERQAIWQLHLPAGHAVAGEVAELVLEERCAEDRQHGRRAEVAVVGGIPPEDEHRDVRHREHPEQQERAGHKLPKTSASADGATASVRAMVEPMVAWLWFGGLVMFGGALFSLWPRGRAVVASPSAAPVDATVDAAARPAK